jgi:hypothetical protein
MDGPERIDRMIAELADWRGKTFAQVRKAVLAADRGIVEEWKWMGSPVWSLGGMIAVGNAHKAKVKITFAYGAHLPDPDKLFNAKDTGNTRRAIDLAEGDKVDGPALTKLVRAAIAYNQVRFKKKAAPKAAKSKKA